MSTEKYDPTKKAFRLKADQIRRVIPPMGGCFATDMIVVDGHPVDYMYREAPHNERDSGWRFFAGCETQEYIDDLTHTAIYDVNTIANYDPSIIPHLSAPPGSAFERDEDAVEFRRVRLPEASDDSVLD